MMQITINGRCENLPQSWFTYEVSTKTAEISLTSTGCSETLGLAFGQMCPCWAEYDPKTNPGILGWVISRHRKPEMVSVAKKYLASETTDPRGRGEHYRAAALEVFIRARAANRISEEEWIDLSRLAGEIHSYYEVARIIGVSLEVNLWLAPIAFVFGNERDRAIAALENPEQAFGRFTMGELTNDLHAKMLKYVRRFHKDGERIVARRMERLQEILPRSSYGYVCHQVGWEPPDLTEEEKELRENYLFYKKVAGVFADASTEDAWQHMAGDLIFKVEILPNMEKGGHFVLRGHGVIDREAAKDYLRTYAQRVVEAVKNLE